MSGFRRDFDWQLKFLDPIKLIVGPLLLEPAPFEIDAKEATDLLVLTARDMRIACRVRRVGYADRYPWEFTLRSKRDTGAKTELSKVVEGWGDWLFYGHAKQDDLPTLARWFLIDLHAWRAHMIRDGQRKQAGQAGRIKQGQKPNNDGTYFVWFDLRSFPDSPPILVSSSHPIREAA